MQRKFRSSTAAARVAKTLGMKVKAGKACKLKDGTKAKWYTFTKIKKKKRKK